jgi:hypothetical protein
VISITYRFLMDYVKQRKEGEKEAMAKYLGSRDSIE